MLSKGDTFFTRYDLERFHQNLQEIYAFPKHFSENRYSIRWTVGKSQRVKKCKFLLGHSVRSKIGHILTKSHDAG